MQRSVLRYGSDDARALHEEYPPVDLHADPLLWTRLVGYDLTKRHTPPMPMSWLGGHVDIPRLREGGLGGQFFGLVSLPGVDLDPEAICHRQIDELVLAQKRSEHEFCLARTASDVERAHDEGRVAGLLGIEGAHALRGDVDAVFRFAARGVKYLGLLHFSRNECGSPAMGFGADREGLTAFGREVVLACETAGLMVDLAHINRRGFFDVCAMVTKPPIVSHTGLAGVHDLWRNIDDEQLRAVADRGGIVGVIFCPRFLGRDGVEAVVDHLVHIANVAGEDACALGSDWDGFVRPTRGLEEACKLPNLTDALLARGLSRAAIGKLLRGNALRVLRESAYFPSARL